MDSLDKEIEKLRETARVGDALSTFKREALPVLKEHVLDVLDRKAFKIFKKVEAADTVGILESQWMSKIVDMVTTEIDSSIEQGNLARETLKSLPEEDE